VSDTLTNTGAIDPEKMQTLVAEPNLLRFDQPLG
jgi:hypothetical protein